MRGTWADAISGGGLHRRVEVASRRNQMDVEGACLGPGGGVSSGRPPRGLDVADHERGYRGGAWANRCGQRIRYGITYAQQDVLACLDLIGDLAVGTGGDVALMVELGVQGRGGPGQDLVVAQASLNFPRIDDRQSEILGNCAEVDVAIGPAVRPSSPRCLSPRRRDACRPAPAPANLILPPRS